MTEKVNHPPHYGGDNPHEVIKCLEAWNETRPMSFHVAWAIKHLARAGHKIGEDEITDLQKAEWYVERYLSTLAEAKSTESLRLQLRSSLYGIRRRLSDLTGHSPKVDSVSSIVSLAVVDALNDLINEETAKKVELLLENRILVTDETVEASPFVATMDNEIGLLGVVNGILDLFGAQRVAAVYDDDTTELKAFKLYE